MKRLSLVLVLICLGSLPRLTAEVPLEVGNSRAVRARIVERARAYLGTPYVIGGESPSGMDCSGLVFRVYGDAVGLPIPRTVRQLYSYSERLDISELEEGDLVFFNTVGPLSHMGIYIGDSRVVHAASEGRRTGVIISSLDDAYYQRVYYAAGRLLPSAGWIGLYLRTGAAPIIRGTRLVGDQEYVHGISLEGHLSYSLFGLYPGISLKAEYDGALDSVMLPLSLTFGLERDLWFSLGRTFRFGGSNVVFDGSRSYRIDSEALFNTFGAGMQLLSFRFAGQRPGVYTGLSYTRMVAANGTDSRFFTDMFVGLKAYLGVNMEFRF